MMKHTTDRVCPECETYLELAKGTIKRYGKPETHLLVCPNCFFRLWKYYKKEEES